MVPLLNYLLVEFASSIHIFIAHFAIQDRVRHTKLSFLKVVYPGREANQGIRGGNP